MKSSTLYCLMIRDECQHISLVQLVELLALEFQHCHPLCFADPLTAKMKSG